MTKKYIKNPNIIFPLVIDDEHDYLFEIPNQAASLKITRKVFKIAGTATNENEALAEIFTQSEDLNEFLASLISYGVWKAEEEEAN